MARGSTVAASLTIQAMLLTRLLAVRRRVPEPIWRGSVHSGHRTCGCSFGACCSL